MTIQDFRPGQRGIIEDYGLNWPKGVDQSTVELKCFLACRDGEKKAGMLSTYEHAERACRLLWDQKQFCLEAEVNGKVYENTFTKTCLKELCENTEVIVTGSASSSKTMPASAYALLSFFADPTGTMVILSTTSLRGADTRAWSQVRELFNESRLKVGYAVEHIKAIVFDPSFELGGKRDVSQRDLRNGIMVLAVPPGADGKGAVKNIIGLKNHRVIWIIDEMPEMTSGIMDEPVANLESNEFFQFIGLGNAKAGLNPHRIAAEPVGGWEGFSPINQPYGGKWNTKSGGVCVFLDGHRSPNMHPELLSIKDKKKLPFPFLANHITLERNAMRYGHGDREKGEKTLPYLRMCRGIWPEGESEQTVLSASFVKENKGDEDVIWGGEPLIHIAALDPSFTSGGDECALSHGVIGTPYGEYRRVLKILGSISLNPSSDSSFEDALAKEVKFYLDSWGVAPNGFGLDISADGGKVATAIIKALGSSWSGGGNGTDIHCISSMGGPTDRPVSSFDPRPSQEAYDRLVTEYWMSVRVGIEVGVIKKFDISSAYAKDFFVRPYEFKGGDKVGLLSKKDLKKAIGRSPDHGDSVSYLVEVARRNGLDLSLPAPELEREPEVWIPGSHTSSFDNDEFADNFEESIIP